MADRDSLLSCDQANSFFFLAVNRVSIGCAKRGKQMNKLKKPKSIQHYSVHSVIYSVCEKLKWKNECQHCINPKSHRIKINSYDNRHSHPGALIDTQSM